MKSVVGVIFDNPTIREVVVEVHTDARESDAQLPDLAKGRAPGGS